MKITKEDQEFLSNLINSYNEARIILKSKQEEIIKLSKELEDHTKKLNEIRESENAFVTRLSKREGIEESVVIAEIIKSLESKK